MKKGLFIGIWMILIVGCTAVNEADSPTTPKSETEKVVWIQTDKNTIQERFILPKGYTRVEEQEGSFGKFLRSYPLKDYGEPILLFDGREKRTQSNHEAVFDMKLANRDLQQCADSIMRIYAEYLYASGKKDKIAFHFVQGFLCDYTHWSEGYRVAFDSKGNPYWDKRAQKMDNEEVFEKYLTMVFSYCSTLSMEKESVPTSPEKLKIGDVFLLGGSPGHVVMVVDLCMDKEGNTYFLLAQGFMPAQEFHVLKNPASESPWYAVNELEDRLVTPEYIFEVNNLRHPVYLD